MTLGDYINVKANANTIVYQNKQYGFNFALPQSFKGYSIVNDKWHGTAVDGADSGKIVETGPEILIRHPLWTSENPRQDIPIMIFTKDQWNKVEQEKIAVSGGAYRPVKTRREFKVCLRASRTLQFRLSYRV